MAKVKQFFSVIGIGASVILWIGFWMYADAWFMSVRMDWFGF